MLTVERAEHAIAGAHADEPALPFGPLDPAGHRTLELGLRAWVREQTGLELGYVEQLYTFADRNRDPSERAGGPRMVSIAYLALVREGRVSGAGRARWRGVYEFLPWEDWRSGQPQLVEKVIAPALARWVGEAERRRAAAGAARAGGHHLRPARARPWTRCACSSATSCSTRRGWCTSRCGTRPPAGAADAGRSARPRRADGARPPPDRRHRARPPARQAQVPARRLRAAADHVHAAPAAARRRGALGRAPAQAELPPPGRVGRPGRGDRACSSRGRRPARRSCSASAARSCASAARPGVGVAGRSR